MIRLLALALVASCSWLPPDTPPQKPAPIDPDVKALVHPWQVENHVLSNSPAISDADARAMHGRKVEITATGYRTPFTGTCDDATHTRHDLVFADLLDRLNLGPDAREVAIHFGFGDPIVEYDLACGGDRHSTDLVIYISGDRAMSSATGACYLLAY